MSAQFYIVSMEEPLEAVAALQPLAFPPPFPEDRLWKPDHLRAHIGRFPEGQFVAMVGDQVVGSCSNCLISEAQWQAHANWDETVGGPFIQNHNHAGTTLYGLDITVHPDFRRAGIGRAFYRARFGFVRRMELARFGTACRMPGLAASGLEPKEYVRSVQNREISDITLTPLLRYGMRFLGVLFDYMEDPESQNAAALLEWTP